jgi:TPR repeat protein
MADRQAAAELGRRGGLAKQAKAQRVRVLDALGLRAYPSEAMAHYLDDADQFAKHETERLAQTVGGGHCGAGPASMVQSAALALAASRYLYGTGEPKDLTTAARLADSSKQQLLTAFELCAREAQARADQPGGPDPFEAAMRRINGAPRE